MINEHPKNFADLEIFLTPEELLQKVRETIFKYAILFRRSVIVLGTGHGRYKEIIWDV